MPAIFAIPFALRPQATASSTANAASNSDAAKAAARKKQFEQDEQLLEQSENNNNSVTTSIHELPAANPDQTLFVSPAVVSMLLGETQAFMVFDIGGHDVSSRAQWSLTKSNVAEFVPGSGPTVIAKGAGAVTLTAKVGAEESTAELTVYQGTSLPIGTARWTAPEIPGFKVQKITPAVPSANGPDVFVTEMNDAGEVLLRAFFADGRQLSMTRLGASSVPANSPVHPYPTVIPMFPHR
jgi:hypothetical protein